MAFWERAKRSLDFPGEPTALSGDVAYIHIAITTPNLEIENQFWKILQDRRPELESQIRLVTLELLGEKYKVPELRIYRASIGIWIVVSTAFIVLTNYKTLVENIELLVSHIRGAVERIFGVPARFPFIVHGTWTPGPAFARTAWGPDLQNLRSSFGLRLLLWYLVLSHAALLTVLIWILITRLQ